MINLRWTQSGNNYRLVLPAGEAIIELSEDERKFYPRLLNQRGEDVVSYGIAFAEFGDAEDYIVAVAPELDPPQKQIETLTYISQFLPENYQFHKARVEHIKAWLQQQPPPKDQNLSRTNWHTYNFTWQEEGNKFIASTQHGKIVITEEKSSGRFMVGAGSRYHIRIIDPTGVETADSYPAPIDFEEAENRVREILQNMEHPDVNEIFLDHLTATLEICIQLLPENADPIHYIRLKNIAARLEESLP